MQLQMRLQHARVAALVMRTGTSQVQCARDISSASEVLPARVEEEHVRGVDKLVVGAVVGVVVDDGAVGSEAWGIVRGLRLKKRLREGT